MGRLADGAGSTSHRNDLHHTVVTHLQLPSTSCEPQPPNFNHESPFAGERRDAPTRPRVRAPFRTACSDPRDQTSALSTPKLPTYSHPPISPRFLSPLRNENRKLTSAAR